jgi:predicted transcriptional regulator
MDQLIGFVSGNDKRERILGLLASQGELDKKYIAKRTHIILQTAVKILGELVEKGLVEEKADKFLLTETGIEVENKMKGLH